MTEAEKIMNAAKESAEAASIDARMEAAKAFGLAINKHVNAKEALGVDSAAILGDTASELGAALAANIDPDAIKDGKIPTLAATLAMSFAKGFMTMALVRKIGGAS